MNTSSEVDLVELFRDLLVYKWMILSFVILAGVIAGGYAYMATPVYEAKVGILPPSKNDIANLNYGRTQSSGLSPFSVTDVYSAFVAKLNSDALRRTFFNDVYLPSLSEAQRHKSQDRLYEDFSQVLFVVAPGKDFPDRYSVAVRSEDPATATEWADRYVKTAGDLAKQEVIANATKEAEVMARNLDQQIATLREGGARSRMDTIKQLDEALKVARAIGLERPLVISTGSSVELAGRMDGAQTYMRGVKALEAEVKNLESRESDDPFIDGLRELQGKYLFYKGIEVRPADVAVYRLDGQPEKPDIPVKPRQWLVLLIGLVSGALLGVSIALFRMFLRKNAHL
ncbi:Wzz/FepE/Etk N-terminal domain-containing protein [Pseudomonas batumici]|uniref:LPS O-antigen chain length determinant protein WzzB n=1 Tax=Pseudomonas batumici TaxID=226910 RepID=UPI0030D292B8